ncbi:response regulator [Motilimonas eburnea]|uniref:response regulator n=1 Tax=Motilimonas eburnea TaxID=1737488 RepID=UPI001E4A96A3|nr:response regulator [Motilimonas eburnea]MCE2573312.1 response regulator [Motilimonas eburnea]
MRALVVDDTMCLRHILHHMLRDFGFDEVEEAADGIHALKLIKAHPFDLIVTDINMPKLDGLGLLKQVRSNPFTLDLPVLMVTSEADKEHLTLAIRADVSGFLAKPFTQNALEKQLQRIGFKKPQKVS